MREVTGVVAGVEVTVRVGDRVRIVQQDEDVEVTWVGPVAQVRYYEDKGPAWPGEMDVTLTNEERLYLTANGEDTIEVLSPAESGS